MKKTLVYIEAFAVLALAFGASAHVTLDPREAIPGRQNYWVRVPTERPVATVSLRLEVPENVEVTSIIPTPGWTYKVTRASSSPSQPVMAGEQGVAAAGKITEITWSGGKINPGELGLFGIGTNYQGDPTTVAWKAYQTYASGEVVAWDDTNEKTPAPKVAINAKTKLDMAGDNINAVAARVDALEKKKPSNMDQYLAIAALVLSIIALARGRRAAPTA